MIESPHIQPRRAPAEEECRDERAAYPTHARFVEELAGRLREELQRRGLDSWEIFASNMAPIDAELAIKHAQRLGEGALHWSPCPLLEGGEQPVRVGVARRNGKQDLFTRPTGILWFREHEVLVSRWLCFEPNDGRWEIVQLLASESLDHLDALARRLSQLDRSEGLKDWQVVTGRSRETWSRQNTLAMDDLVLTPEIRHRLRNELLGFFTPEARDLYARLRIPYRRNCLLHGQPGCGKTSIARAVSAALPHISTVLLRPHARFDDGDLIGAMRFASTQAPCIFVVEDLEDLFERGGCRVSTFLNLIDGILVDHHAKDAICLIATTNNPTVLPHSISDRPGRFDVVMEIPAPGGKYRREYFMKVLDGCSPDLLEDLAEESRGLSFAHCSEIIRLAGLRALRDDRAVRSAADLRYACEKVRQASDQAHNGFSSSPGNFGFQGRDDP